MGMIQIIDKNLFQVAGFFGTLVSTVVNCRQANCGFMSFSYGFFSAKKTFQQHLGRRKPRFLATIAEAVPALGSLTSQKKPYVRTLPPRCLHRVLRAFEG